MSTKWPTTACRSCGARVIWTQMASGKQNPMDAQPDPHGQWVLARHNENAPIAALKVVPMELPDVPRFSSHFASCPNADQHRRSR